MPTPRFALNHMAAPSLDLEAFLELARALEMDGVEIRNDLDGIAIADGTPPERVREAAAAAGLSILSINALQRFNDWTPEREAEAVRLADYAAACGAQGLVLVPVCDGTPKDQAKLEAALAALAPILAERALTGLVEPLGFDFCSLRSKAEVVAAIEAVAGENVFRLIHDTFHHHLAGEDELFPAMTGLVHISGVADPDVAVADMRDPHRVLVDADDRLDNLGQIAELQANGYLGPLSFEPFARSVHGLADPEAALRESTAFITERLVAD
jgi:2-keto-myo-inositol isomerase